MSAVFSLVLMIFLLCIFLLCDLEQRVFPSVTIASVVTKEYILLSISLVSATPATVLLLLVHYLVSSGVFFVGSITPEEMFGCLIMLLFYILLLHASKIFLLTFHL